MANTTPQYEAVNANWKICVKAISATPGPLADLQTQFKMKYWLDTTQKPNADELITQALGKIESDVKNYDIFIKMLSTVVGLQDIVEKIKAAAGPNKSGGVDQEDGPATLTVTTGGETHVKMCLTDTKRRCGSRASGKGHKQLVEKKSFLWHTKELNVLFLGEIPAWRNEKWQFISPDEILKIANSWNECNTNVVPKFVSKSGTPYDIRVKFNEDNDNSSLVGTEAIEETESMWLDLRPTDKEKGGKKAVEYKSTILHEFGHALGLEHEHQHPDIRQPYDDKELKKVVEDKDDIDTNWKQIENPDLKHPYDKDSIMHYLIPEKLQSVHYKGPKVERTKLSEGDKGFIVEIYSGIHAGKRQEGNDVTDGEDDKSSSTSPRSGKLNIDKDVSSVKKNILKELNHMELKDLFSELGIKNATLQNNYQQGLDAYADVLICTWIRGDQLVERQEYRGGATWENLKKALNRLGFGGTASKI